jgi:soluble lytic murein transglycosylase-like protein
MQLMPKTARELGVDNAFSAAQNIDAGSRYLAQMLQRFDGNISLACAAYNAGPTTVSNYKGVPPYPETQAYVERVGILLQRYRTL